MNDFKEEQNIRNDSKKSVDSGKNEKFSIKNVTF